MEEERGWEMRRKLFVAWWRVVLAAIAGGLIFVSWLLTQLGTGLAGR